MIPNFKIIAVGLFCALLISAGVMITPVWEYSVFVCAAIALAILYFTTDGKARFCVALGLSTLSIIMSVIAMVMFASAEDFSFNLASINVQDSGFEQLNLSYQWPGMMSPAKYWELLLNASIALLIITATFCLLVPGR
jgi:uncharacterized membrane protein